jgi:hypothetical protein
LWASASVLVEEPAKLPAGGIEGSLLVFPAVTQEGAAVIDHFEEVLFNQPFSQGRFVVEVANELFSQHPYVVDVFLAGLRRQIRRCQIFEE